MTAVHHIVLGDRRHGVTRLGRALLPRGATVTRIGELGTRQAAEAARSALPAVAVAPAIHVHLNDELLGVAPAAVLAALASGRRLAITLHDVPQPQEGASRYQRRLIEYGNLANLAELAIVCSQHERDGLRAARLHRTVEVVEHPIDADYEPRGPRRPNSVGVIGWVYPGKGHADVIEAMSTAMPGGTLLAIGAVSPAHADLREELQERARQHGVDFRLTGYVSGRELLRLAGEVAVPVCAHGHVSASGSMGTWLAAGRVPIVADGPYAREVLRRCPGALTITDALAGAITSALEHPNRTQLTKAVVVTPTTQQAADRQESLLHRWSTQ